MRVVTLVPAATEIVAALGGAGQLVGISHECDYPISVQGLPRVTTTPVDSRLSGGLIDAEVRRLREAGTPVIGIDAAHLEALRPHLIVTQGLCNVCAVADGLAYRTAERLPLTPKVLSMNAGTLAGIWTDIYAIGAALGLSDEAEQLVLDLKTRLRGLRQKTPSTPARVVCVEWLEPLYLAGHWVPDLVEAAGGMDIGATSGGHSARREWQDLRSLEPDCVVVMLCGFGRERARRELEALEDQEALELMSRVPTWIIDGNSFTSRPGPRVVDGAKLIQSAILGRASGEVEAWNPQVRLSPA
jgi:iron complex transport system substrate-binding protein